VPNKGDYATRQQEPRAVSQQLEIWVRPCSV